MSSLEEEVLKENISAAESYGEQFSDKGPIYYWNKEAERIFGNLENIPCDQTADPPKLLYKKILAPSSQSEVALTAPSFFPPPPLLHK